MTKRGCTGSAYLQAHLLIYGGWLLNEFASSFLDIGLALAVHTHHDTCASWLAALCPPGGSVSASGTATLHSNRFLRTAISSSPPRGEFGTCVVRFVRFPFFVSESIFTDFASETR